MRLLIVDNQIHVVQWLTSFIPVVLGFSALTPMRFDVESNLKRATKLVMEKEYETLFLRHDLEQEPESGEKIRTLLIKNPEVNKGMLIICHGLNEVSDPKNAALLAGAGRIARWFPLAVMPSWQFSGRQ